MYEKKKIFCPKCNKEIARRQMCGKCGKMNILPCNTCRKKTESCQYCGAILI